VDQDARAIQVCTIVLQDRIPGLLTKKISSKNVTNYRIGRTVAAIKVLRALLIRAVEVAVLIEVGMLVISSGIRE